MDKQESVVYNDFDAFEVLSNAYGRVLSEYSHWNFLKVYFIDIFSKRYDNKSRYTFAFGKLESAMTFILKG